MKVEHVLIDRKEITRGKTNAFLSLFIMMVLIGAALPVHAGDIADYDYPDMFWKHYPYHPYGTDIVFPTDEGSHGEQYAIEWWYVNFHLIGESGREYGAFVAFYKLNSMIFENQQVRLFSISDLASEKIYTNAQIGTLTTSSDHLDLSFKYRVNANENFNGNCNEMISENSLPLNQDMTMTTNGIASTLVPMNQGFPTTQPDSSEITNGIVNNNDGGEKITDESIRYDHWYTKTDGQGLLPFQYALHVGGDAQQDNQPMSLMVDMDCLKEPLIVGGDGFLYLEDYGFSFYYSLTKLTVTGSLIVHGFSEKVNGFAWIDHQWGSFLHENQPPYGLTLAYEWFSIRLDDNREIMMADTWDRVTQEKIDRSFTGGMNILQSDGSSELLENYKIHPQAFWNDPTNHRIYACKWRILEMTKAIDLLVTPVFLDQVMRVKENYPLLQQFLELLFPGACFWEGICTVTGTINGVSVSGTAYVELTHYRKSEEGTGLTSGKL